MLSVCIITKNEENNLSKCLESIISIATETILIDTGSDDSTIEIARSYGCKIYSFDWNNDFSSARNFGIDMCTQEWILCIDADEILSYEDKNNLLSLITTSHDKEAFYLKIVNLIDNIPINESHHIRLFKNNKIYRYCGRLYEDIFNSIKENNPNSVFEVTNITLYHYGYDYNISDVNKKIERNISILESTPIHEMDCFYYYNLGNEYFRLNNISKAKELFIKSIETKSSDFNHEPSVYISLGKIFLELKEYMTGLNYIDDFIYELKDFRDLYFIQAALYYELMNFTESLDSLSKFIQYPQTTTYPSFNFEQENNIDALYNQLQSLVIPTPPILLVTVINLTESCVEIENTIKNANEISDAVYIIYDNTISSNVIDVSIECGAIPLYVVDSANIDSVLINTINENSNCWLLRLGENITLSHNDRVNIYNHISNLNNYNPSSYNIISLS